MIEEGKQYVMRNGKKSEPVLKNDNTHELSMGLLFKTKATDDYHSPFIKHRINGKCELFWIETAFDLIAEYIPPNTININGYDVPEPVREPLKNGKEYYAASPHTRGKPYLYKWEDCEFDKHALKNGLIHKNKKAVKKHNRALMSFTKLNK